METVLLQLFMMVLGIVYLFFAIRDDDSALNAPSSIWLVGSILIGAMK